MMRYDVTDRMSFMAFASSPAHELRPWVRILLGVGALAVVSLIAGMVLRRGASTSPPNCWPRPAQLRPLDLTVNIQTIPEGAEVYIQGSNEFIGIAPFRRSFHWQPDQRTVLLFHLPGYQEVTRDVQPTWTGLVRLRPVTAP